MTLFEADRPLRVAVLFSGGASGFRYLAGHDPAYGDEYEVVCGYGSDPDAPGTAAFADWGIPVAAEDVEAFYEARDAATGDLSVREEYDRRTREYLSDHDPDVVVLSGYMWILTDPVVSEWPVLNVHPADLTVTDDSGDRKYVGSDPVAAAVEDGATETRSTVHLVTPEVDRGPVLVRSKAFPVHRDLVEALDRFDAGGARRDYLHAHQEWMKWEGDGPALAEALSLVAAGRVEREGSTVLVDGDPGGVTLD